MGIVILAGTKKGVAILESDAARETWTCRFDLRGWAVTSSIRDGHGRFMLAVASDVYGPALFVSEDLKSWEQLEAAPRFREGDKGNADHNCLIGAGFSFGQYSADGRHVDQIWTLHDAGDAIYAGVSEAGLFKSTDRGQSWEPVSGLNDHPSRAHWMPGAGGLCAHTILTDRTNPERIWVGISAAGLFRSDDGGKTWDHKNEGVPGDVGQCVHCLAHDPRDPDRIFRQDHQGVFLSEDGGDHWRQIETGLPAAELAGGTCGSFGFPIAMDHATGAVFIVPLEGDNFRMPHGGRLSVYRSRDSGASWAEASEGLPEADYSGVLRGAMAADQADPGGVYFGTTTGTVYGSQDLGDRWTALASGLPRILSVRAYAQP